MPGFVDFFHQVKAKQQREQLLFDRRKHELVYSKYTDLLFSLVWGETSQLHTLFPDIKEVDGSLMELAVKQGQQTFKVDKCHTNASKSFEVLKSKYF